MLVPCPLLLLNEVLCSKIYLQFGISSIPHGWPVCLNKISPELFFRVTVTDPESPSLIAADMAPR